ncbi:MAG TPA: hydrogenase subunit beta, partial [Candidatus Wallbacteria bacterium]|nr:hydrogenase subunit beta [Candidatus Wallbacteria bacterium]
MSDNRLFKKGSIAKLLEVLKGKNAKFLAPVGKNGGVYISEIKAPEEISFEHIQTDLSAKSVVFPQTEEILNYTFEEKDVTMNDRDLDSLPETVVFGIRPCEAASFGLLNSIFNWDTEDIFFKKRLEKTTVITIGCKKADDFCFCTSVNMSPGSAVGSDIFLTEFKDGEYLAEILTEKGKMLVAMAGDIFGAAPAGVKKEDHLAKVPVKFDIS